MTETVLYQRQDAIAGIALNRPDKKNAITKAMYQGLADSLKDAADNPETKVIVLYTHGDNFTAGNDLADFLQDPSMDEDSPVYQFLQALVCCPLPVIAAVKGFAIGIGSTMLLHCEQVFAAPDAVFAMPFVNLGLVPEAGASLLLPRLIGYRQAADILMTGDSFSAEAAQQAGFISQVAGQGVDVNELAMAYAETLSQKPRSSLVETKRLLRKDSEPLQDRLHDELAAFIQALEGPAAREAMTAFMEKRKADFSNF